MKRLLIALLCLIPVLAYGEWKHSNPADLSVEYARLGQILVSVQDASIDVTFTEGRVQYYMDNGIKKCRWIGMGASHKTFRDDYKAEPMVLDFSRMLQWVAGNIGPGFTAKAETLMATELGDVPVELLDVEATCLYYTTSGVQPQ